MTKTIAATERPPSDAGVVFPLVDGARSTLATGRHIIAMATHRVDTAIHEAARDEPDWRSHYAQHFRELTRLSAQQHAPLIASDGLAATHEQFRYLRQGAEQLISDAIAIPRSNYLRSFRVEGQAARTRPTLTVPFRGRRLDRDQLRALLDEWLEAGVAEPSFAQAIGAVIDEPEWLDLRDSTFVVMGAGAEVGPYQSLLRWGAHVVAVDLPDPELWRQLIELARRSPGTLTIPVRGSVRDGSSDLEVARSAGVDVVTETPEVYAWLGQLSGPYVVGDYVYAQGADHVRATVAVDAIVSQLTNERQDVGLAYLATPTDVYAVPSNVVEFSQRRHAEAGSLVTAVRGLSGGNLYRPNYANVESTTSGLRYGLVDALVPQQGPNYALAKRIQRWRAFHARSHGTFVSINVAPATRTRSVVRNRLLASAYSGAHRFGLEVFDPSTSSTLMAALLVRDFRSSPSLVHLGTPMDESYEMFVRQALHGGMWRGPFAPRSVLGIAVALGMFQRS